MKKILFISLAMLLAACSTVQPVQQEQPAPAVATVLVTVIAPTEVIPPTVAAPAEPVATEVQPTAVPPTEAPATEAPVATADTSGDSSGSTSVSVDKALGKGIFEDIVISSDVITLNCTPREIKITMKAVHPDVTRGEWYYRLLETDQYSVYSDIYPMGKLGNNGDGTFFAELEATDINADWRGRDKVVVEVQFIGVNKGGGVVGRTDWIARTITYYKECP